MTKAHVSEAAKTINSILEKINQDLTRTDTAEEAKLRKLAAKIMPVLRRFYKDWY